MAKKPTYEELVKRVSELELEATERKQWEEELKARERRLLQAQKMEAIGTLAGGIAHDFNNILGIILGNAELSLLDVQESDPLKPNLEAVKAACYRARDLIGQLLSFSRQTEQETMPINIVPIIKESVKFLRSSIPTTINIHQNISSISDLIMADPTQIHQIIINLCTNAAHAMRDNGGVLKISLKTVKYDRDTLINTSELIKQGRYIQLSVEDTGHGIPAKIRDKIFDPYFTTKQLEEGTGLGLSVVHGIVKSLGGSIAVWSEPGKETRFDLCFPAVETGRKVVSIEEAKPLPKGSERILLVDDEEKVVQIQRRILERLGYTVTAQASSAEALETFRQQPDEYDLVISDTTMPELTGDRLAQKIIEIRPDIPVILCSGFSDRINKEKAQSIGIRSFLMKPVLQKDMARTIREVLDET